VISTPEAYGSLFIRLMPGGVFMFIHEWNRKICLECLDCVKACPNDNLTQYEGRPTAAEINTCVGCFNCRDSCSTKAVSFSWLDEAGYSKDTPSIKQYVYSMSKEGKHLVSGMGARRKVADMENLVFLPGQLFQPPLLEDHPIDVSVILGKKSLKPITLDVPIMIGAMSFGALTKEAKIALAKATAKVGSIANSGEGGMLPEEREAAKYYTIQYSTGRFGVTQEALKLSDMIEIKIGQGAKPGMGGHLLKEKITEEIARVRNIPMGKDAISPAKHPDINSKEDLKEKVEYLKHVTGGGPVGIKLAGGHIEKDMEIALFAGVDVITIDGMEGGTGAAPIIAKEHAALPLIYALSRAARYLEESGKKDEVTLIAAGGVRTAADFAKSFALGAEAVYISSSAQMAMGCIRCRACHTGRCPTGICAANVKSLDVDKAAESVANFIEGSVDEIKILCRLIGKDSIHKLQIADLAALDEESSRITGVQLA
jgi:isopentenyl diphosphate isomerase/L-lactate dehydrogenase-like FMN-dependent dehydrogenase/Pyruvate/2-oxoacid:ferredoxin oxidoreductase delta subunit